MNRKTVTLMIGLGLAGLGMQLAQRLVRGEIGSSYAWVERVGALELGVVLGLLGIVIWSLARARLVEALENTRLEDVLHAPDEPEAEVAESRREFVQVPQESTRVKELDAFGRGHGSMLFEEPEPVSAAEELLP